MGVSGGVDSSVAAYLLKQAGHEVHGVFIKTWSPEWLPCTWVDEKRDAMRICALLDIPFHFLDAEAEYQQGVADYMIAEYRAGRTPNPDVLCNRVIKFGVLWDYAKSHGADAIATGHYAQIIDGALHTAADAAKDQSYFLWMLQKDELSHIAFPIGHLQKAAVRAIAEQAGLFTAAKKDSQGICFLGDVNMKEFLAHYIENNPGDVVDEQGRVIGTHDGVLFYTIGERHGFRITAADSQRSPYYVIGKDLKKNLLIVSAAERTMTSGTGTTSIELREQQWMVPPVPGTQYEAQLRYHGTRIPISTADGVTFMLKTIEPIPLGQSLVLYDGTQLIGGGIIDKTGIVV